MGLPYAHKIRRDLPVILFLILSAALVYGQVANFDFVNFDDFEYVRYNFMVQKGLTWEGIQWAFTSTAMANWHPLTWLSHMLDCQLFGLNPGAHHLINLSFHLLNSVLLFLVLRQMTGCLWQSAFVAALFALHPLHVESVAWIAERKDVLSTLFWILAMGAYAAYARSSTLANYLLVVLFFCLGLMAKPMLVTLPVLFLLMDYWPLNRFRFVQPAPPPPPNPTVAEPASKKKRHKGRSGQKDQPSKARVKGPDRRLVRVLVEKIPLFILSAVSSGITIYAQEKGGAVVPVMDLRLAERMANAVVSYVLYLWKMIWPLDLAVFYPFQYRPLPDIAICAAVLVIVSAAAFWKRKPYPYLLFGWLWYLVSLLPVIGLIKVGNTEIADRYTYITLTGPFMALAWWAADTAKKWHSPKYVLPSVAILVVSACMALTTLQVGHWRNSVTLFSHALNVTENNFMAHNNLAAIDIREGKLEDAMLHLEKAQKMHPRSALVQGNMGIVMVKKGKIDEAVGYFEKALSLDPRSSEACLELGNIYLLKESPDRAIEYFECTLRSGRHESLAYTGLAEAFIMTGQMEQALSYGLRALEGQPDNARLHYNIANIYVRKGRIGEAVDQYKDAVRIQPDYAKAHNNLGSAYLLQNRVDEAIQHFQEAVRIDPDYRIARENLKDAQAQKKKLGK
jgi:protein O-mannosyl-transferase